MKKIEACGDYIFYQAEPNTLTYFQNPQKPKQLTFNEPLLTFTTVLAPDGSNTVYLWLISETEICLTILTQHNT
jgi:hypothetical protein